jgi:hypothetical protein
VSVEKPALRVIDGGRDSHAPAERIALSFVVYERKRLDIPVSAIVRIEAHATQTFSAGHIVRTYDLPHVEIWLTPSMQSRLHDFTCDMVDQVVEVHVGDKCVARPVVREPLGSESSFLLSASDFPEAQAMADKLRTGWRRVTAVE